MPPQQGAAPVHTDQKKRSAKFGCPKLSPLKYPGKPVPKFVGVETGEDQKARLQAVTEHVDQLSQRLARCAVEHIRGYHAAKLRRGESQGAEPGGQSGGGGRPSTTSAQAAKLAQ